MNLFIMNERVIVTKKKNLLGVMKGWTLHVTYELT